MRSADIVHPVKHPTDYTTSNEESSDAPRSLAPVAEKTHAVPTAVEGPQQKRLLTVVRWLLHGGRFVISAAAGAAIALLVARALGDLGAQPTTIPVQLDGILAAAARQRLEPVFLREIDLQGTGAQPRINGASPPPSQRHCPDGAEIADCEHHADHRCRRADHGSHEFTQARAHSSRTTPPFGAGAAEQEPWLSGDRGKYRRCV